MHKLYKKGVVELLYVNYNWHELASTCICTAKSCQNLQVSSSVTFNIFLLKIIFTMVRITPFYSKLSITSTSKLKPDQYFPYMLIKFNIERKSSLARLILATDFLSI